MAVSALRSERRLTGPYWAAIERHELVRPVCGGCNQSHFPPQGVCPSCQSTGWTYEPSSGRGSVYSHTTIHRPPFPEFDAPYVVADIEMDEGWRLFSWLINCDPASVSIGMTVEVAFVVGAQGEILPMFEPARADR